MLRTVRIGLPCSPSWQRVSSTVALCASAVGELASTTWRSRVRRLQLLERRAERRDQLRRELLDEADGVGEEEGVLARHRDASRERIEGGEGCVGGQCLGARERLQQRRLAGVRVADERDDGDAVALAPPPVEGALRAHGLDLALESADPAANQAAVGLELRLTGAARPDRALEPLEVLPLATQPREQVLVLCELDLQRRLSGAGAAREDVEDQRAAVEHLHVEHGFEAASCCAGESCSSKMTTV